MLTDGLKKLEFKDFFITFYNKVTSSLRIRFSIYPHTADLSHLTVAVFIIRMILLARRSRGLVTLQFLWQTYRI